jgi:hypothetical protein
VGEEGRRKQRDRLSRTIQGLLGHDSPRFLSTRSVRPTNRPLIVDRKGTADIFTGKHSCSLELQFSAEATVRLLAIAHRRLLIAFAQTDSLRSSLHKLEGMLRNYSPLMTDSTEKALEKVFKFGAAFSEVSS